MATGRRGSIGLGRDQSLNLLGDSQSKAPYSFPWFALRVRSRRETMIAAQLEGQGFECFLPLYKSIRRWSDRLKELEQPLFPGYLFCRFDFQNRSPILMTPGVQQIVGVGRTPIPVEESELESIRKALASHFPNHPYPYPQTPHPIRA